MEIPKCMIMGMALCECINVILGHCVTFFILEIGIRYTSILCYNCMLKRGYAQEQILGLFSQEWQRRTTIALRIKML